MASEMLALTGADEEEVNRIYMAGTLHDIGKIGIRDNLLFKPGKLTSIEFNTIKKHPHIGANILAPIASLNDLLPMVAQHHERFDGKGYPEGLAGTEIPLAARLSTVADVFDALTSKRVYKDATDVETAREMIVQGAGTRFDPQIVEAFQACFARFVQIKLAVNEEGEVD